MLPNRIVVPQVVATMHPHAGGFSKAIACLSDALSKESGLEIILVSQASQGASTLPTSSRVYRSVVESNSRASLALGLPVKLGLNRLLKNQGISIIHSHGLWQPANHWAAEIAKAHKIPLIVQPHGMLEPWAVNHKPWKKRMAMLAFQKRDIESAKLLIATSQAEYKTLRRFGFCAPIAVVPNGIQLDVPTRGSSDALGERVRTALFLSRIHPVKGLINLIQAWKELAPGNWCLRIAGPDEGGHLSEVMKQVRQDGLEGSVEYIGEVYGDQKSELYTSADLFVLPTFTENFGLVIAEALAHGLPVITTKGAPWPELGEYGCGWWIDIGKEPLVDAMREAMTLSDRQRLEMGQRGVEYVKRFDLDLVSQKMVKAYDWLLNGGVCPDFIQLD